MSSLNGYMVACNGFKEKEDEGVILPPITVLEVESIAGGSLDGLFA